MLESDQIVPRPRYTDRIAPYIDTPVIKVLTGARRSGKSTILDLVAQQVIDYIDGADQLSYYRQPEW